MPNLIFFYYLESCRILQLFLPTKRRCFLRWICIGRTKRGKRRAVEKGFQGGGDRLRAAGVNLKSLAIIESAEPGNIVFRGED